MNQLIFRFAGQSVCSWMAAILLACSSMTSKDSATEDATDSSIDETSSSETTSGPHMLPLEDQPGYKKPPYGACPYSGRSEESCGGKVVACLIDDRDHPTATACLLPCDDKGMCPPSDDRAVFCTGQWRGCLISCEEDAECPEGMLCGNPGGTRYCAWPVLWSE